MVGEETRDHIGAGELHAVNFEHREPCECVALQRRCMQDVQAELFECECTWTWKRGVRKAAACACVCVCERTDGDFPPVRLVDVLAGRLVRRARHGEHEAHQLTRERARRELHEAQLLPRAATAALRLRLRLRAARSVRLRHSW